MKTNHSRDELDQHERYVINYTKNKSYPSKSILHPIVIYTRNLIKFRLLSLETFYITLAVTLEKSDCCFTTIVFIINLCPLLLA